MSLACFAVIAVDIPPSGSAGGALPSETPALPSLPSSQELLTSETFFIGDETPGAQRLKITYIKIKDVVERPEAGITSEVLETLANKLLKEKYVEDKGVSIHQLRQIALALTLFYREKGFILTRVILPEQSLTEELSVILEVEEGRLGRILVEDNERYDAALLAKVFQPYIGQPVVAEQIEAGLLTLNNLPGLTTYGVFRPGDNVNETNLIIKVAKEKRVDAIFATDNTGTQLTGRYHGSGNVAINNPLGFGDQLSGNLIWNFDPQNGVFGSGQYQLPIFSLSSFVGVGYNRNEFDLGGEFSTFSGISEKAELYFIHDFIRTRTHNFSTTASFARKNAETTNNDVLVNKDKLAVLALNGNYSYTASRIGQFHQINAGYSHGFNDLLGAMGNGENAANRGTPPSRRSSTNSNNYASGKFDKFTVDYDFIQRLFTYQLLSLKVKGQYSNSLLVSLEQFSMGGVNNVRAYPTSEELRDSGIFTSAEWSIAAPGFEEKNAWGKYTWSDILRFSAFVDYSKGWLNQAGSSAGNRPVALWGYGGGIKLSIPGKLALRLQVAQPFPGSPEASTGGKPRYWFSLNYLVF